MTGVQKYLLVSGLFIIAVGLFYGAPKQALEESFGLLIDEKGLHIFRAIMGLYCGVGVLVLIGSRYRDYAKFSLLLETVFFGGIGIGRLISFVIDGNVHSVSVGATVFEMLLFAICLVVLKIHTKTEVKFNSD